MAKKQNNNNNTMEKGQTTVKVSKSKDIAKEMVDKLENETMNNEQKSVETKTDNNTTSKDIAKEMVDKLENETMNNEQKSVETKTDKVDNSEEVDNEETFNELLETLECAIKQVNMIIDGGYKFAIESISEMVKDVYQIENKDASDTVISIIKNGISNNIDIDEIILQLSSVSEKFNDIVNFDIEKIECDIDQLKSIEDLIEKYNSSISELKSLLSKGFENETDKIDNICKTRVKTFLYTNYLIIHLFRKKIEDISVVKKTLKIYKALDAYKESAEELFGNKFNSEAFDKAVEDMKDIISENIYVNEIKPTVLNRLVLTNSFMIKPYLNRLVVSSIFNESVLKLNKNSDTVVKYVAKIDDLEIANIKPADISKLEDLLLEDLDK